VYAYANPKSSTGRIFLLTRVIADGVEMYDALVGPGWKGELWVLVRPETFPVLVRPGIALCQIRLFDGKAFLDKLALELALEKPGLFFTPSGKQLRSESEVRLHGDSFLLTIGLPKGVVGWECVRATEVLDLGKKKFYNPEDFFRPVRVRHGKLDLVQGGHYILTTFEHLRIPPDCAAELRAIDPRFGEFRSHSAGFFDPGWGMVAGGQPITLEITAFENMTVESGQIIARVRYERMKEVPNVLYGSANSNYTAQTKGPKLSKHFRTS
jgi:dCTP deaminase